LEEYLADFCALFFPQAHAEIDWARGGAFLDKELQQVVRDYRTRRAELEASDNPFATVVLAHLAVQDTRRSAARRREVKLALTRRLYERGYSLERVLSLFRFIDWL